MQISESMNDRKTRVLDIFKVSRRVPPDCLQASEAPGPCPGSAATACVERRGSSHALLVPEHRQERGRPPVAARISAGTDRTQPERFRGGVQRRGSKSRTAVALLLRAHPRYNDSHRSSLDRFFVALDPDGSGFITFKEFKREFGTLETRALEEKAALRQQNIEYIMMMDAKEAEAAAAETAAAEAAAAASAAASAPVLASLPPSSPSAVADAEGGRGAGLEEYKEDFEDDNEEALTGLDDFLAT